MKNPIIIIGGGGHAKVVIELIEAINSYNIKGVLDPNLINQTEILGYPVLGNDDELKGLFKSGICHATIGIGSNGDNQLRRKLWLKAMKEGYNFPTLIHPNAVISPSAKIGEGCQVFPNVVIHTEAKINKLCVINTGVIVEHECQVGINVFISSGALLCGKCKIGNDSFIGARVCLIPKVELARKTLVAAGAVVINNNHQPSLRLKGVPAHIF